MTLHKSAFVHWCSAVAVLGVTLTASGAVRHFVNAKFLYELDVPDGWNIEQTLSGVPVLFNYKRSMAGPQGLFPDDGAEIRVIPLEEVQAVTGARTIDEWIKHNYGAAYRNISKQKVAEFGTNTKEPKEITEVQAEFERDPQDGELQTDLSYYFMLNGAPFRLRLLYWKDNSRGANLRATCFSLLRTIRAR